MRETQEHLYQSWLGNTILDRTRALLLSQHNKVKKIQIVNNVDMCKGLISLQTAVNGNDTRPRSLGYNSNSYYT